MQTPRSEKETPLSETPDVPPRCRGISQDGRTRLPWPSRFAVSADIHVTIGRQALKNVRDERPEGRCRSSRNHHHRPEALECASRPELTGGHPGAMHTDVDLAEIPFRLVLSRGACVSLAGGHDSSRSPNLTVYGAIAVVERICAWCGKKLGAAAWGDDQPHTITHGICDICSHHLLAEMGMELGEFLDGLDAPVLVVDPVGTIKTANKHARDILQKTPSEIEGRKGGEVFECANARLPGGCGDTVHCTGCTMRLTVMDTFQSGNSHTRVPAYLRREDPDGLRDIRFLISTKKVEGVVLLRIDEVGNGECVLD